MEVKFFSSERIGTWNEFLSSFFALLERIRELELNSVADLIFIVSCLNIFSTIIITAYIGTSHFANAGRRHMPPLHTSKF